MTDEQARYIPPDNDDLVGLIMRYVKARGLSRLRGKSFDITQEDGLRNYAEWLAGEIESLDEYADSEVGPGELFDGR